MLASPVFNTLLENPRKRDDNFDSKFHPGVKKCHFGNFSEWAGMAVLCPVSPALNNPSQELKNDFCFGCRLLIHRKMGPF